MGVGAGTSCLYFDALFSAYAGGTHGQYHTYNRKHMKLYCTTVLVVLFALLVSD